MRRRRAFQGRVALPYNASKQQPTMHMLGESRSGKPISPHPHAQDHPSYPAPSACPCTECEASDKSHLNRAGAEIAPSDETLAVAVPYARRSRRQQGRIQDPDFPSHLQRLGSVGPHPDFDIQCMIQPQCDATTCKPCCEKSLNNNKRGAESSAPVHERENAWSHQG